MGAMDDFLRIDVPLHWTRVLVKGNRFDWHKELPKTVRNRDLVTGARIYRWVLRQQSGKVDSVYIGESGEFHKRLASYRTGKNASANENYIRTKLRQCGDAGGSIELEFLDLDKGSFHINGKLINEPSLCNHDVRLMMESIAIVAARVCGLKLLNRLQQNVAVKDLLRLVKHNPRLAAILQTPEVKELIERP